MKEKTFDEYYKKVSTQKKNALKDFRENKNIKELIYNNIKWRYFSAGEGQPLFIIPGGLRRFDSIFPELIEFSEKFRVISPDIPFINSGEDIIDGFYNILTQEKIEKINIMGRSFGGSIVQGFYVKYPKMVNKIILCSTVYNDKDNLEKINKALKMYNKISEGILKSLIKKAFFNILKKDTTKESKIYWKAFLSELFESNSVKEMMISQLSIAHDLLIKYPLTIDIINNFKENILIIYAKDDVAVSKKDQLKIESIFPNATKKIFDKGGHTLFQTQKSEYFETVINFISN